MIAFLAITTVINIALGYALAVYLGRCSHSYSAGESVGSAVAASPAQDAMFATDPAAASWLPSSLAAAPPSAPGFHPAETAPQETTVAKFADDPADQPAPTRPPVMEREKDLLAGIEEFRNQLAQLKGQSFDEGVPGLAATESVG